MFKGMSSSGMSEGLYTHGIGGAVSKCMVSFGWTAYSKIQFPSALTTEVPGHRNTSLIYDACMLRFGLLSTIKLYLF